MSLFARKKSTASQEASQPEASPRNDQQPANAAADQAKSSTPRVRIASVFDKDPARRKKLNAGCIQDNVSSEPEKPKGLLDRIYYRSESGERSLVISITGKMIVAGSDEELANGWYIKEGSKDRVHFKDGVWHHDSEAAMVLANGRGEIWYRNGKMDRSHGPALDIKTSWGAHRLGYYKNGLLHREGEPALVVEEVDGSKQVFYYQNNLLHREDGPAEIFIDPDGNIYSESWIQMGHLHRLDGPALINTSKNGVTKAYYQEGELHRLDGPAIERSNGEKIYYLQGLESDKKEVSRAYLENKRTTIGVAKKSDLADVDDDNARKVALKDKIEQWKKSKAGMRSGRGA